MLPAPSLLAMSRWRLARNPLPRSGLRRAWLGTLVAALLCVAPLDAAGAPQSHSAIVVETVSAYEGCGPTDVPGSNPSGEAFLAIMTDAGNEAGFVDGGVTQDQNVLVSDFQDPNLDGSPEASDDTHHFDRAHTAISGSSG